MLFKGSHGFNQRIIIRSYEFAYSFSEIQSELSRRCTYRLYPGAKKAEIKAIVGAGTLNQAVKFVAFQ